MPKHPDFQKMYDSMIQQYGEKKGKEVYYATINKKGLDDTKAMPKEEAGVSEMKECPRCGKSVVFDDYETQKKCPKCGAIVKKESLDDDPVRDSYFTIARKLFKKVPKDLSPEEVKQVDAEFGKVQKELLADYDTIDDIKGRNLFVKVKTFSGGELTPISEVKISDDFSTNKQVERDAVGRIMLYDRLGKLIGRAPTETEEKMKGYKEKLSKLRKESSVQDEVKSVDIGNGYTATMQSYNESRPPMTIIIFSVIDSNEDEVDSEDHPAPKWKTGNFNDKDVLDEFGSKFDQYVAKMKKKYAGKKEAHKESSDSAWGKMTRKPEDERDLQGLQKLTPAEIPEIAENRKLIKITASDVNDMLTRDYESDYVYQVKIGSKKYLVDPQGYTYARYVGLIESYKKTDDDNGQTNCPNCGRKQDERSIDWEAGNCRFCKGDKESYKEKLTKMSEGGMFDYIKSEIQKGKTEEEVLDDLIKNKGFPMTAAKKAIGMALNKKESMQWGVYDAYGHIITAFDDKPKADKYVAQNKGGDFFVKQVDVTKKEDMSLGTAGGAVAPAMLPQKKKEAYLKLGDIVTDGKQTGVVVNGDTGVFSVKIGNKVIDVDEDEANQWKVSKKESYNEKLKKLTKK